MGSKDTDELAAHVRQDDAGKWHVHGVADHLDGVGDRAADFAADFGAEALARVAGRIHDLGKFNPQFLRYLKKASGYDPDAHLEGDAGRPDHSTAGALWAEQAFGEAIGLTLGYLAAGHHAGLLDWEGGESSLSARLRRGKADGLLDKALASGQAKMVEAISKPAANVPGGKDGYALWVRMLFSCLVDADFLDTEAFMDTGKAGERGQYPALAALIPLFDAYMGDKADKAPPTPVNRLRADILRQCRDKAALPPGVFSLSVPTGGGKTLSSMAFALGHAHAHGKRRVIHVIPYTSIIEQTANVFREIFGNAVVEHHSNLDPDKDKSTRARLAAENWDAPIIVTTNVQFFESLFAARTSRTRKLHNIVNSVVVLDEAQLLPAEYLEPILHAMNLLCAHYGVSFVLSTATQPALVRRDEFARGLAHVTEIMDDPDGLGRALERVRISFPKDEAPVSWETLAGELAAHSRVLTVVSRRDDCRALHHLMPEGTIHLSALMCGEHRSRVIKDIKDRLKHDGPVRVVSTQLVEAGVDLDFPVVYRAFAGLDSILQAAGRCNREGALDGMGDVVVFNPPSKTPPGMLRKAAGAAREILHDTRDANLTREVFERYFRLLYWSLNSLDAKDMRRLLRQDVPHVQFREAAEAFQLIPERDLPVIVRYGDSPALLALLESKGPERWLMRKLQRYVVTIPRFEHARLLRIGDIKEVSPGFFAQTTDGLYNEQLGLMIEEDSPLSPSATVV